MILGAPACKAKGTAWAGFYWRGESIGRLSKLSLERGIRGMGANGNGIIKKKIKAKGTWELRGEKGELIRPPPPSPTRALGGGLALRRHAAERADVAVAGELILHEHHVEEKAVLSPSLARRLKDRSEMRKRYAGGGGRGGGAVEKIVTKSDN